MRPLIFAIVAIVLSIGFSMLAVDALLSFSFGSAIVFAFLFLIAPFIAAFIVGYRRPVQLLFIFVLLVVIGSFMSGLATGVLSFILTFITYISSAWITELFIK